MALAAADAVFSLQCKRDRVLQRRIGLSVLSFRDEVYICSFLEIICTNVKVSQMFVHNTTTT